MDNLRCPRCGSEHIGPSKEPSDAAFSSPKYQCEDCGYLGPLVLSLDEDVDIKAPPPEPVKKKPEKTYPGKLSLPKAINEGLMVVMRNPLIYFSLVIGVTLDRGLTLYAPSVNPALGFFILIISFLVNALFNYTAVRMSNDFLVKREVSFMDSFMFVLWRLHLIIVLLFIYLLGSLLGAIVLILPGIYIMIRWNFAPYAFIIDGLRVGESFSRSWDIVKGNWWKVFFLIIFFLAADFIPFFLFESNNPINFSLSSLVMAFISAWSVASTVSAYRQLSA